mgnify:CR=1 FL=1
MHIKRDSWPQWIDEESPAAHYDNPLRPTPQWRWLYALLPLLVGLLLTRRAPTTGGGHMVSEIVIVLLVYGLVSLWLHFQA